MTELERLFRQIVRNLAATDPAGLHRPIPLADIPNRIVPYRTSRRALELESSEDYEMALLQLCAGAGGLARAEPEEVRAEFEAELSKPYPDLGILHRHDDAVLNFEHRAVARWLDPKPELAFAPPEMLELHETELIEPRENQESSSQPRTAISRCSQCNGVLPGGRIVNFCPHCGRSQLLTRCPVCESEVESGWRHCASCGYLIGDG